MSKNMWEVKEEDVDRAMLEEYNKTKKDLLEYMQILREWAATQPHFPEIPGDRYLRVVLLSNKFSIEKAKQRLDMYYSIRSMMPEVFTCEPLSPRLLLQSKVFYLVPLPKTTPDFKRVIFSQMNPEYKPEDFIHSEVVEHFVNVVELLIHDDDCFNFVCIFDCKGVRPGHTIRFNPMNVKKGSIILEKVFNNRCAAFYLVNFYPFLENIFNTIFMPMITPKIRERIKIHSGTDVLFKNFPKEILPKDIGGDEKPLAELNEMMLKKFEEKKERFEVLRTLRVDESLRPEKLINDEVLGYYGNFKKLSID